MARTRNEMIFKRLFQPKPFDDFMKKNRCTCPPYSFPGLRTNTTSASLLPSNNLKWTATKRISSHPDKNNQSSCHRCQTLRGQMMHCLWSHLIGEMLQGGLSQWVRYSLPWKSKWTLCSELWWEVLLLKTQARLSCCYFLIEDIASDISPTCTINLYTPRTLWNILYELKH